MHTRHSTTLQSQPQKRRIFRGQSGPTDRNLPPHQARRRRPRQRGGAQAEGPSDHSRPVEQLLVDQQYEISLTNEDGSSEMILCDSSSTSSVIQEQIVGDVQEGQKDNVTTDDTTDETELSRHQQETRHLAQRIHRIQESLRSSKVLSDPDAYEKHALRAVANCVTEYKSVRAHCNDDDDKKNLACAVFMLIQQALQCGPLAGSKPGYFKRCGSVVALRVVDFLDQTVPNKQASRALCLSDKQCNAIETWRQNATKAVETARGPSKSVQGKMDMAQKKRDGRKGKKD